MAPNFGVKGEVAFASANMHGCQAVPLHNSCCAALYAS